MWLTEVYQLNKELDKEFLENYQTEEKMEKDFLSLLVEIGELANETRCFKYWSVKGPSEKEVILEEFADVLTMVLCFCNYLKVEEEELNYLHTDLMMRTVTTQFIELYQAVLNLKENYNKEMILSILSKVLVLGHSLGYDEKDMHESVLRKMKIVDDRLHSNY